MEQEQEKTQRWTAKRRVALVVEILRGDTSVQEAARQHGLTVADIEQWKERFLSGAENALRSRPLDEELLICILNSQELISNYKKNFTECTECY